MKDQAEKQIREEAKRIRKLLKGGTLYGVYIDWDNPDHLLAAAYYFGLLAGRRSCKNSPPNIRQCSCEEL